MAIAKGLPTTLNYLNLDFNTLEKEGVAFLTRQLENGQGGNWIDKENLNNTVLSRLPQVNTPWALQFLSMRENGINDFAVEDICSILHRLQNL